jgi:hypothetical protein
MAALGVATALAICVEPIYIAPGKSAPLDISSSIRQLSCLPFFLIPLIGPLLKVLDR